MKSKERIISIANEGKQYFIYFEGTTHYDEDRFGRPIEAENFTYLDSNFNKWILNIDKDESNRFLDYFKSKGVDAFIGAHSPETETVDGEYVPNTNPNTVGIWIKPTKEELTKYHKVLEKQNKERQYIKLA